MGNSNYAMDEEDVAKEASDKSVPWAIAAILETNSKQILTLACHRATSEEEAIGKMYKVCMNDRPDYTITQILAGKINI